MEQGHSAPLWSPTDDDRLLCNVTLPVLWGWRKVRGGSGFLPPRHPGRLFGPVESSSNTVPPPRGRNVSDADRWLPVPAAALGESAADGRQKSPCPLQRPQEVRRGLPFKV